MLIKSFLVFILLSFSTISASAIFYGKDNSKTTNATTNIVILLDKKGQPSCGGAYIHPQIVVTAAHCIVKNNFSWSVKTKYGRTYNVSDTAVHPQYWDPDVKVDLALLFFKKPFPEIVDINLSNRHVFVKYLENGMEMAGIRHFFDGKPKADFKDQMSEATLVRSFKNIDKLALPGETMLCKGDSGYPIFSHHLGKDGVLRRVVTHINVGFATEELHNKGQLGQCSNKFLATALYNNLPFILPAMENWVKGSTQILMLDSEKL